VAVLDTSPLLLWLAGKADSRIIATFKHLNMFQVADYELLDELLGGFTSVVTTPHVLTEVSNHARHLKGSFGLMLLDELQKFSNQTTEIYRESKILSERYEFRTLGITDCALAELSETVTVVTTDFRLAGYLQSQGKQVINFNHRRQTRLLES
jgi:predicted nucleic acid-binding protein